MLIIVAEIRRSVWLFELHVDHYHVISDIMHRARNDQNQYIRDMIKNLDLYSNWKLNLKSKRTALINLSWEQVLMLEIFISLWLTCKVESSHRKVVLHEILEALDAAFESVMVKNENQK